MFNKTILGTIIIIILMSIYVVFNPSYQKSIQAKYYFEIGKYEEALVLAKEAFALDVYNRMSSTIMAQSLISLQYKLYIDDAKKYQAEIDEIATHTIITQKDRAKIRLICGIMVDSYSKLSPSVVTDESLVVSSKKYYLKFEKLLEKVNR